MKQTDARPEGSPAKRCGATACLGAQPELRARQRQRHSAGAHACPPCTLLRSPCRTVVWNEDNLAQCEAGKDAKMKIDEPETPWASPPKELYSDDGASPRPHATQPSCLTRRTCAAEAPDAGAAGRPADMAHVAAQLAAATARPAGVSWGGAAGEGAAGLSEAAPEARARNTRRTLCAPR